MTLYLILVGLLLGSIAPSLAAPGSPTRVLRFLLIFAIYPVLAAIAVFDSVAAAGLLWLMLGVITLVLERLAERLQAPGVRAPLLGTLWKVALLWPLMLPAALESLLIAAGLAPPRLSATLPDPPRGGELFSLPDDELLVAAHQILGSKLELTETEQTFWLAETFSREVHVGGLAQWFSNPDASVTSTVQALREVGALKTADLLLHASPWDGLCPDATTEDLTRRNALFLRRNRHQCPNLEEPRPPPQDQASPL